MKPIWLRRASGRKPQKERHAKYGLEASELQFSLAQASDPGEIGFHHPAFLCRRIGSPCQGALRNRVKLLRRRVARGSPTGKIVQARPYTMSVFGDIETPRSGASAPS